MSSVPAGARVIAYISIAGAAKALEFYAAAFDAEVGLKLEMPDGKIGHAEVCLGGDPNATFWLADEWPDSDFVSPTTLGKSTAMMCIYVPDVDAAYAKAVEAGATSEAAPEDQFFGDRVAKLRDPFGYRWSLHQRLENLTPEEVAERMAKAYAGA